MSRCLFCRQAPPAHKADCPYYQFLGGTVTETIALTRAQVNRLRKISPALAGLFDALADVGPGAKLLHGAATLYLTYEQPVSIKIPRVRSRVERRLTGALRVEGTVRLGKER